MEIQETMALFTYIIWHYTYGIMAMARDGARAVRAMLNLFAVPHHLKTLFYPWHQYNDPYPSGFDLKKVLWVFSGNMIGRILGAIVRTVTITAGLFFTGAVFAVAATLFVLWLLLPLLVPSAFAAGIIALFY